MARNGSSGEFCFVHAADLHLDTPFKGLSETAPQVAAALRDASLRAFDALVRLCLERSAAFLLIAGDVYDGPDRGLRAQLRFRDGLQRLSDAGIDTFVVHGNHDPVDEGWSAVGSWPERVHFFGCDRVESVPVERDGTALATIQGISYPTREVTANLALRFARAPGDGLQIGLLHCNVAGAPEGHARYSPCTLEELRGVGLDYWALGHVHARTVMSGQPYGGEPFVVYPGNLQARSPKPSERGAKGATVVTVRGGRIAGLEAVECDVVRFAETCVDIGGCESLAELQQALVGAALTELEGAAGRSLILRGRLEGRGPVHAELRRSGIVDGLLRSLRDEASEDEPFVWWDRLEDATRPAVDLGEARDAGDFVADLLATADALAGDPASPSLPLPATAALPPSALNELLSRMPAELRSRASVLLDEDTPLQELIEAAARLALDHLEAV